MKVDKIKFDKIKQEWDILRQKAIFLLADQEIIQQDATNIQEFLGFEMDIFGNVKNLTEKDLLTRDLEAQLNELKKLGRRMLDAEDYLSFKEAKEMYETVEKQLNKLNNE